VGRPARYEVVSDTPEHLLIRDLGPWDVHFTVTSDAAAVVFHLQTRLGNRRLFYIDSEGELDELLVHDGRFVGFRTILTADKKSGALHCHRRTD
jgi:hypothetical protein